MAKKEVVEYCPECENEVVLQWDTDADGFEIVCPYCGKKLMLCDECQHTVCEDGEPHDCDWDKACGECHRCKSRIAREEAELIKASERSKVRRAAYEKFKLWWCMRHGVSMAAIFSVAAEFNANDAGDLTAENIDDFLSEVGFGGGSLYPCFGEFLAYEYKDVGLMHTILDSDEFDAYLAAEEKEYDYSIRGQMIEVDTPLGIIVARDMIDPEYPGISLFLVSENGEEIAGGVMEYSPTFRHTEKDTPHESISFRYYANQVEVDCTGPSRVCEITA